MASLIPTIRLVTAELLCYTLGNVPFNFWGWKGAGAEVGSYEPKSCIRESEQTKCWKSHKKQTFKKGNSNIT